MKERQCIAYISIIWSKWGIYLLFLLNTYFRQYPICISALVIRVAFYVARSIQNVATFLSRSCFAVSKRFYFRHERDTKTLYRCFERQSVPELSKYRVNLKVTLLIIYRWYCTVHTSMSISGWRLLLGSIFHLFRKKMFPFGKNLHGIFLHTLLNQSFPLRIVQWSRKNLWKHSY